MRGLVNRRWVKDDSIDIIGDAAIFVRPGGSIAVAINVAIDNGVSVLCGKGVHLFPASLTIDRPIEIYGQPGTEWRCVGDAVQAGMVDITAKVKLDGIAMTSDNANRGYFVRLMHNTLAVPIDGNSSITNCTFTGDADHIYSDSLNNIIKDNTCVSTVARAVLIYLEDTADLNHVQGNNLSNTAVLYPDDCAIISVKSGTMDERYLLGWSGLALLSTNCGPNWAYVVAR